MVIVEQPWLPFTVQMRLNSSEILPDDAVRSMLLSVRPYGGQRQCEFSNEFSLAEALMNTGTRGVESYTYARSYLPIAYSKEAANRVYPSHWGRALEEWYPPSEGSNGGADAVAAASSCSASELLPLRPAATASDFTTRGLVIDGECLLSSRGSVDDQLAPVPGGCAALRNWLGANGGVAQCRLIVLLQPTMLFQPRTLDPNENEIAMAADNGRLRQRAVQALRRLVVGGGSAVGDSGTAGGGESDDRLPAGTLVYYLWLDACAPPPPSSDGGLGSVADDTQPSAARMAWLACAPPDIPRNRASGRLTANLLAWAIRRHSLDLGKLIYVCSGCCRGMGGGHANCHLARSSGLGHVKGDDFLGAGGRPQPPSRRGLPQFLRPFAPSEHSSTSSSSGLPRATPPLPLVLDGRSHGLDGTPEAEEAFGRIHGVIEVPGGAVASASCAGVRGGDPASEAFTSTGANPNTPAVTANAAPPPNLAGLYTANDVKRLSGGDYGLAKGKDLRQHGKLSRVSVTWSAQSNGYGHAILIAGECVGSQIDAGSSEVYTLEVCVGIPPGQLLLSRSCTCKHFVDKLATGPVDAAAPSPSMPIICKHLSALMLEALHRVQNTEREPTTAVSGACVATAAGAAGASTTAGNDGGMDSDVGSMRAPVSESLPTDGELTGASSEISGTGNSSKSGGAVVGGTHKAGRRALPWERLSGAKRKAGVAGPVSTGVTATSGAGSIEGGGTRDISSAAGKGNDCVESASSRSLPADPGRPKQARKSNAANGVSTASAAASTATESAGLPSSNNTCGTSAVGTTTAASGGVVPRPKGRPRKGQIWDSVSGTWVPEATLDSPRRGDLTAADLRRIAGQTLRNAGLGEFSISQSSSTSASAGEPRVVCDSAAAELAPGATTTAIPLPLEHPPASAASRGDDGATVAGQQEGEGAKRREPARTKDYMAMWMEEVFGS